MKQYEVQFPGNKKVDVTTGPFTIQTDQLPKYGGEGTAPEPFDLFLASLAACAGIYAKSFCDHRKIDVAGMHLSQEVTFNKKSGGIDAIRIILHLNKAFPEKYETAILKTMNGCAVKKQLNPDLKIETLVSR